jgi:hypothetical protein
MPLGRNGFQPQLNLIYSIHSATPFSTYERDAGGTSDHHWDQLYLNRIRYADYTELGTDGNPVDKFLVSVTFVYEERVGASREQLTQQIQQRLAENDTRTPAFQLLGRSCLSALSPHSASRCQVWTGGQKPTSHC